MLKLSNKMLVYIAILIPLILYFIKKFANGRFTNLRRNMSGKKIIITGSSAGLGKETAFQLLDDGADVIFACRDETKTRKIIETHPNIEARQRAHFIKLDLNSFQSVHEFAEEVKKKFSHIDILMNNAGLFPTKFFLTNDKIESAFQTNVLSHIFLTYLLLEHFNKNEGRIINLSSHFHVFANYTSENLKKLLQAEKTKSSFDEYYNLYYSNVLNCNTLYGNTKVGNIFFTQSLAEYLKVNHPNLKTVSLHPGAVYTDFTSNSMSSNFLVRIFYYFASPFIWLFFRSPIAGAQTQLHVSYMDWKELINGAYYENCRNNTRNNSNTAKSEETRIAFMEYCVEVLKKRCQKYQKELQMLFNDKKKI